MKGMDNPILEAFLCPHQGQIIRSAVDAGTIKVMFINVRHPFRASVEPGKYALT
jgi:hypothetical protein